MALTSNQKAARTRRLKEAGRKAAATRRRRAAGKKAAKTRIRRAVARKAVATRMRRAATRATSSAESGGEANGLTNWSWREGIVDVQGEHIELRYGDAAKGAYEQWLPISLIGKPTNHVFPVLWVMSPDDPSRERMIGAARKELDFYLVEHLKEFPHTGHPWEYAIYHCNTGANMYSSVRWSYFPKGNRGRRISSRVIRLTDGSKAIFKPEKHCKMEGVFQAGPKLPKLLTEVAKHSFGLSLLAAMPRIAMRAAAAEMMVSRAKRGLRASVCVTPSHGVLVFSLRTLAPDQSSPRRPDITEKIDCPEITQASRLELSAGRNVDTPLGRYLAVAPRHPTGFLIPRA